MPSGRISIYLKQGDSYFFLARAWAEMIKHKGVAHSAILFQGVTSIFLRGRGVESVHLTYPDTGEIHQTYAFPDGKKLHVSSERMSMTWSREFDDLTFPDPKFITSLNYTLQRKDPPRFEEITGGKVVVPVNSAILMPIEVPEALDPKSKPKASWTIIELAGLSGSLNVRAVLSGTKTPVLDGGEWVPTYSRDFLLGESPPYFGWSLRLFPPGEPERAEVLKLAGAPPGQGGP